MHGLTVILSYQPESMDFSRRENVFKNGDKIINRNNNLRVYFPKWVRKITSGVVESSTRKSQACFQFIYVSQTESLLEISLSRSQPIINSINPSE